MSEGTEDRAAEALRFIRGSLEDLDAGRCTAQGALWEILLTARSGLPAGQVPKAPAAPTESLAAILAEMRKAVVPMICGRPKIEAVTIRDVLHWADRIEAAYKREHADWHAETDAAKEERNRIACKMRYEFAAKCRACKAALEAEGKAAMDGLRAALSAPARNCDRFATADEARDAVKAAFANTMLLDDRQLRAVCDWLFDTTEGEAK